MPYLSSQYFEDPRTHTLIDPYAYSPKPSKMNFLKNRLSRRGSTRSKESNTSHSPVSPIDSHSLFAAVELSGTSPRNSMLNPSPPTRRPASAVYSNEPPPAYTPSSSTTPAVEPVVAPAELPAIAAGDSPYAFLSTFDTIFLIDDSGSMAGRSWNEVSMALKTITPICTSHDQDGIDIYFLNHKSSAPSPRPYGTSGGYTNIRTAEQVDAIFKSTRPTGGTPTGTRLNAILRPYLKAYEEFEKTNFTNAENPLKPINIIVLTDGVPTDDLESVLLATAKRLDRLDAPSWQIGVQFFQVGNEQGAKEALNELDDALGENRGISVRDMVDTVTWQGRGAERGLTGEGILKVVLGAVVKRLDRRRASGESRRSARP